LKFPHHPPSTETKNALVCTNTTIICELLKRKRKKDSVDLKSFVDASYGISIQVDSFLSRQSGDVNDVNIIRKWFCCQVKNKTMILTF